MDGDNSGGITHAGGVGFKSKSDSVKVRQIQCRPRFPPSTAVHVSTEELYTCNTAAKELPANQSPQCSLGPQTAGLGRVPWHDYYVFFTYDHSAARKRPPFCLSDQGRHRGGDRLSFTIMAPEKISVLVHQDRHKAQFNATLPVESKYLVG